MKRAIFLFEHSGLASMAFKKRGWHTTIIDLENSDPNPRADVTLNWNILKREKALINLAKGCDLGFGFPPCTDMAVSGAKHFEKKRKINPKFQEEAVHLALSVERIFGGLGVPWAFENPVSVLSTLYRKPDFMFHPNEYGGWLPRGDRHPDFPEIIKARDRYPKLTCLWAGNGFQMPKKKPLKIPDGYSLQFYKLGGKSKRTKMIRSASPRGFFEALAESVS